MTRKSKTIVTLLNTEVGKKRKIEKIINHCNDFLVIVMFFLLSSCVLVMIICFLELDYRKTSLFLPDKVSGIGGFSKAPGGIVKPDFGLISLGTGK